MPNSFDRIPQVAWIIIGFLLLTFLYKQCGNGARDTYETFELENVLSLPPFPEYENATPMMLLTLYVNHHDKLVTDLRNLNLPEAFISDPKNYPVILSTLKRLNLLPNADQK